MAYAAGNIPVGAYDPSRLATTGLGYWAVDGGAGYTYYDEAKGHEFSAVLGFTYSFMNQNTAYQTGIDMHLDLSASQYLNDNFYAGVAGYFYNQITGDSGPGAVLRPIPVARRRRRATGRLRLFPWRARQQPERPGLLRVRGPEPGLGLERLVVAVDRSRPAGKKGSTRLIRDRARNTLPPAALTHHRIFAEGGQ